MVITRAELLEALARHIGRAQGVTARDLVREITGLNPQSEEAAKRELRSVVEDLRMEGWHVCAHPGEGYYMAATPEELDRTCVFLYARAIKSLLQIARMKKVSDPDLRGQLRLPT